MPVSHGSTCHVPGNVHKQGEACSWKGHKFTHLRQSLSAPQRRGTEACLAALGQEPCPEASHKDVVCTQVRKAAALPVGGVPCVCDHGPAGCQQWPGLSPVGVTGVSPMLVWHQAAMLSLGTCMEVVTCAELSVLASMPAQAEGTPPGAEDLAGIAGLLAEGHSAVQAGEAPMHLLLQTLSRSVDVFWNVGVWQKLLLMRQLIMQLILQDRFLLAAAACRGAGTWMLLFWCCIQHAGRARLLPL